MNMPKGFRYGAVYAGIRKVAKDDLCLIVSDTPASAASVFTRNRVVAAPVDVARSNLRVSRGRIVHKGDSDVSAQATQIAQRLWCRQAVFFRPAFARQPRCWRLSPTKCCLLRPE